MTYATADDVVELWAKEPEPEVRALITRRLAQLERKIVRRIPDLHSRVEAGLIDRAELIDVESDVVLRVVRNPEGYVSEADGAYEYQIGSDAASPALEPTEEEWARIGVTPPGRMFTLSPRL